MVGKRDGIDPAALVIAVVGAGLSLLNTTGSWIPLNTFESLIILLVLWAYMLYSNSGTSFPESLAVAIVIGFVSDLAFAWPVQSIFQVDDPTRAAYWAILPGALVAAAVLFWQVRRMRHRGRPSDIPSDTNTPSITTEEEARVAAPGRRRIEITLTIRRRDLVVEDTLREMVPDRRQISNVGCSPFCQKSQAAYKQSALFSDANTSSSAYC